MAISEAVIAMGRALEKLTIAEGIETPEQAEFLVRKGCVQGQGFWFGRPTAAAEIPALLKKNATEH